ncbi:MAG: hypothetical protein ISR78_03245 [Spirochaetia bacterium]|nr:hypothetical protein [Spirochaetia bacterium]
MKKTTKKIISIFLISAFFLSVNVMAEENKPAVSFALGTIDISDVLSGMVPTYLQAGIAYHGIELIDGKKTTLKVLLGGARTAYTLWTDAVGDPLITTPADLDVLKFAFWQADIKAHLEQELIGNLNAYAEWNTVWALPVENIGGTASTILDSGSSAAAYPDKDGMVSNILKIGILYDTVHKGHMIEGIETELSFTAAPALLLNELFGKTDFYQANLTIEGFLPLYTIPMDGEPENQWLSLYIADRIQADYIWGSAVPQLFQKYPSLGKKMRGFEANSLGVNLTAVNNFELRASGPELVLFDMSFGYPRINLFADTGYCGGFYYNTETAGTEFTASAGVEAAVDIFNFVDIGYRYGFILAGENIAGSSSFGELFFFLHW